MRETNVPSTYTYYHVELDDHSLILAEGVPAETFVDISIGLPSTTGMNTRRCIRTEK